MSEEYSAQNDIGNGTPKCGFAWEVEEALEKI